MLEKLLTLGLIIVTSASAGSAQKTELVLYKEIDTTKLHMEVHYAQGLKKNAKAPAMVFFFGGGWSRGDRTHFEHHAEYFATRGITCFLADYRTKTGHGTTPYECLKDAKSAMRFVRSNAERFGIDSSKIIGSGGSAGGHLAAATALTDGFNEDSDDTSVSCIPNALVLFNPVLDNGPGGFGYHRVKDHYKDFSPLHSIREGAPPTILFLGTEDAAIPVVMYQYYQTVMGKVGSRCEVKLYEGQAHGFFNYDKDPEHTYYRKTLHAADVFLESLGYVEGEPEVGLP